MLDAKLVSELTSQNAENIIIASTTDFIEKVNLLYLISLHVAQSFKPELSMFGRNTRRENDISIIIDDLAKFGKISRTKSANSVFSANNYQQACNLLAKIKKINQIISNSGNDWQGRASAGAYRVKFAIFVPKQQNDDKKSSLDREAQYSAFYEKFQTALNDKESFLDSKGQYLAFYEKFQTSLETYVATRKKIVKQVNKIRRDVVQQNPPKSKRFVLPSIARKEAELIELEDECIIATHLFYKKLGSAEHRSNGQSQPKLTCATNYKKVKAYHQLHYPVLEKNNKDEKASPNPPDLDAFSSQKETLDKLFSEYDKQHNELEEYKKQPSYIIWAEDISDWFRNHIKSSLFFGVLFALVAVSIAISTGAGIFFIPAPFIYFLAINAMICLPKTLGFIEKNTWLVGSLGVFVAVLTLLFPPSIIFTLPAFFAILIVIPSSKKLENFVTNHTKLLTAAVVLMTALIFLPLVPIVGSVLGYLNILFGTTAMPSLFGFTLPAMSSITAGSTISVIVSLAVIYLVSAAVRWLKNKIFSSSNEAETQPEAEIFAPSINSHGVHHLTSSSTSNSSISTKLPAKQLVASTPSLCKASLLTPRNSLQHATIAQPLNELNEQKSAANGPTST